MRDLEEHARAAIGRQLVEGGADRGCELAVVDERDGIRVVEEERELGSDVAIVDVDRNTAELLGAEEHLHVLGGVHAHDRDLVVGFETRGAQHVGKALGPVVELRERQTPVATDEGNAVGRERGDGLPGARERVVGHVPQARSRAGNPSCPARRSDSAHYRSRHRPPGTSRQPVRDAIQR